MMSLGQRMVELEQRAGRVGDGGFDHAAHLGDERGEARSAPRRRRRRCVRVMVVAMV